MTETLRHVTLTVVRIQHVPTRILVTTQTHAHSIVLESVYKQTFVTTLGPPAALRTFVSLLTRLPDLCRILEERTDLSQTVQTTH